MVGLLYIQEPISVLRSWSNAIGQFSRHNCDWCAWSRHRVSGIRKVERENCLIKFATVRSISPDDYTITFTQAGNYKASWSHE